MVDHFKIRPQQGIDGLREEQVILEKGQYTQGNCKAQGKPGLFGGRFLGVVDGLSDIKINDGGKDQDKKEKTACFIIEEQGDHPQVNIPCAFLFVQHGIEQQYQKEETPEIEPCKDQGRICIEKENIFQPFYRIAGVGDKGGCGLGLYLVAQVMKEHGGRVEVQSEVNRGSLFRLVFPDWP